MITSTNALIILFTSDSFLYLLRKQHASAMHGYKARLLHLCSRASQQQVQICTTAALAAACSWSCHRLHPTVVLFLVYSADS
jgi:hypothetical protein